eukprot:GFYU01017226.1.p1 GENE.GFYU01017226.1~~GFYU01017226.1.p1  ORF type:complete len:130 (+),score=22.72 GFYU01017226.1:160-549(+)
MSIATLRQYWGQYKLTKTEEELFEKSKVAAVQRSATASVPLTGITFLATRRYTPLVRAQLCAGVFAIAASAGAISYMPVFLKQLVMLPESGLAIESRRILIEYNPESPFLNNVSMDVTEDPPNKPAPGK